MNDLTIITPELRAGAGGVGDHTLRLLENWAPLENVTLLVASPGFAAARSEKYRSVELGAGTAAILQQLPRNQGALFVQYSAYGFDRRGYPRKLLHALIGWKRQGGRCLVIMFHEIWTLCPITDKNFFLQWLHRRAIRRLLHVADTVFTSTASQADHLRALADTAPIRVLPVGSNIHPVHDATGVRQPRCAVLFGRQPSRLHALKEMEKSLTALSGSGRITKLISLGQNSNPAVTQEERALLQRLNLGDGFEQRGFQTGEQISEILSSVSFGIFGQSELSLGKSGSFMAYAAHQLNVLAEFADSSKAAPICWLVAPRELLEGISQDELDLRAKRLRLWQEENCSWERIAGELGAALELNQPRRVQT